MKGAQRWQQQLPLGPGVRVLAVDPVGMVALEKPADVMSHPNKPGVAANCLLRAEYDRQAECFHWPEEGENRQLYLLHRLDSPTSGVVLATWDKRLAGQVRRQFSDKKVKKSYFAIIDGVMRPKKGVWTDRLAREGSGKEGRIRVSRKKGAGETARTRYQWMKSDQNRLGFSLTQLFPETGRTHQLRVQCASHGHPIIGDRTYGDFQLNRELAKLAGTKRLFLHAGEISLVFEVAGQTHHFKAKSPLPREFRMLIEPNRQLGPG